MKETRKSLDNGNILIINEWQNERIGMEWQLIKQYRIIDKNNRIIDGHNEFIDTRIK